LTWSLQLAVRQTPPRHEALRQSLIAAHERPAPHAKHSAPPQSTSVSPEFFTPSEQCAGGTQRPPRQRSFVTQSPSIVQALPWAQRAPLAEQEPPQSMSVSLAFRAPSLQLGAAHAPSWQTPLTQSTFFVHRAPSVHAGQGPPQSHDASPGSSLPLAHVAGGAQVPPTHSLPKAHCEASVQR
jgi:hypothetical protein